MVVIHAKVTFCEMSIKMLLKLQHYYAAEKIVIEANVAHLIDHIKD